MFWFLFWLKLNSHLFRATAYHTACGSPSTGIRYPKGLLSDHALRGCPALAASGFPESMTLVWVFFSPFSILYLATCLIPVFISFLISGYAIPYPSATLADLARSHAVAVSRLQKAAFQVRTHPNVVLEMFNSIPGSQSIEMRTLRQCLPVPRAKAHLPEIQYRK